MPLSFVESSDTPLASDGENSEIMGYVISESAGNNDRNKEPGDMGMLELLQQIEGVGIGGKTNIDTPVIPPPVMASNKSVAWLHFDPITMPSGIKKNKCKHCNKLMSVQKKKTTTHLIRHLKEACPMRHKIFLKPLNQAAASGDASN
ncbi:hypothetical protein LIER_23619 [Lithospermum erythrorhizon]|uniref:BED-type domain-containing protein n=1 Tax=Lithospermum erythrorhizon TaxID=34254 RepID=A0AAV3R1H7_LITER